LISILFPTTGRPDRAVACVEQMRDTTMERLEIVAAVDCDAESACRLAPIVDTLCVAPFYRGCSAAWNDALREATADKIVLAADDLSWDVGWAEVALESLEDHPGCLIGFNDGHWDGNKDFSTHYLMPRDFIVEVLGGRVAWDCYSHSFNDREANERARRADRYHWAEDARVGHDHWLFGGRTQDETDTRNLGGHADAERTFKERAASGFPDDYPAIIDS
jgi:hypothetical protein